MRGEDVHTATASKVFRHAARAARPRPALEGEDGQLRDRLRPVGLRPRRPPRHPARGGQGDHRHVPRALPGACARSSRRRSRSATTDGHVTTLWGRRRQIPELKARNWQVRTLGERLAVNTVIQGTAADVMKLAIVRVDGGAARLAGAADPHRPRRAAVRGPARTTSILAQGDDPPRDVRRLGARPAAGRRRRRRADVDGGQVSRELAVAADRGDGRARRAAGADQLRPRPRDRHVAGGVPVVRDRHRRAGGRSPRSRRAGWARSATSAAWLGLPHRRPARRGLHHVRARHGPPARRRRRRRGDDRRPARGQRRRRPASGCSASSASRSRVAKLAGVAAAGGRHVPRRAGVSARRRH